MDLHALLHALKHTLEDALTLIPFLFLTYLCMEYLETRAQEKTINILKKTGKKGPFIGGLLGAVPQCGFSAAAANLYSGGVITVGTMVAVFLSTSDEMLPILISGQAKISDIIFILVSKVIIGIIAGLLVDLLVRRLYRGNQKGLHIHDLCEQDNCHCEDGSILKSALTHTLKTGLFIVLILFAINFLSEWLGMEKLVEMCAGYPILSIFIVSLIGMVPNCAVSVAITTLYLEGVLSFGSMFAGLLACSGLGLVILFKTNRDLKKNLIITAGIYVISVVCGILFELIF